MMLSQAAYERDQRIGVTPEAATVRGLIFNSIFKLVASHQGQGAAEDLRSLISRKPLVDFFSYPARDFLKILYAAAEKLAPRYGSMDAAIQACGAAAVSSFFQSQVGRTLVNIIGKGNPKRLFSSAPTAYSTTVSYGQRTCTPMGERGVRLHFRGDMQPVEFHQGLLAEALRAVGCQGRVEARQLSLDEAEYLIQW